MRGALIGLSCAVLAAVVALLLVWRDNAATEAFASARGRQFALVGIEQSREPQPAVVEVTRSEPRIVSSLSLEGIVTAVHFRAGRLGMAEAVLDLDGVTRHALVSESPPYRVLESGEHGDDVADVAAFLYAAGYLKSPAHLIYGPRMQHGVSAFEMASGRAETGRFQPHYVACVPADHANVVLQVGLGDRVRADMPLLLEPESVTSAKVQLSVGETSVEAPNRWVFQVNGGPLLELDRSANVLDATLPNLAAHLQSLPPRVAQEPVRGVVMRANPIDRQSVPTRAVLVGLGGSTCVIDEDDAVHLVDVRASSGGVSYIERSLPIDIRVMLDPQQTGQVRCGS